MRLVGMLAALALGLVFGLPAEAQTAKKTACDYALDNLKNTRDGKDELRGVEKDGMRLKASGNYKAAADAPLFAVDAYREHGDVRALCPQAKWPESVKPAGLKKLMVQGAKSSNKMFCGGEVGSGQRRVPDMIRAWTKDAGIQGFADRRLELANQLPLDIVASQSAARHASDADWLYEIAENLAGACTDGAQQLDVASASTAANVARQVARDNVNFLACVKARDGWQPQLSAYDAAAKTGDLAGMQAALGTLETAAAPVKAACQASDEGTKENDYILAAKRMQILFLTVSGCREAAVRMNELRTTMNSTGRAMLPSYIAAMRQAAADAGAACKDPSPTTWGSFVAWITEQNLSRTPAS